MGITSAETVDTYLSKKKKKTRACDLRRLTRGEEPNRKTVWPNDTPVIPKRIYISPPELDGSTGVPR